MGLIPLPWRILILLAAAAALVAFGWVKGATHEQTARDLQDAQAERWARATEQRYINRIQEANDHATKRETTIRSLRAALDAGADRLRDTIRRRAEGLPDDTLATCRASASALAAVSEDCAGKYRDLAEAADRHASDTLMLLEAWPK